MRKYGNFKFKEAICVPRFWITIRFSKILPENKKNLLIILQMIESIKKSNL
jgi:hypothetical protein